MLYWVYSAVLTFAGLLLLPVTPVFFLLGERFRSGLSQRFGFYPREVRSAVSGSRPIWIHAASVGEALSAGPLTKGLRERFPAQKIIVSVFTHTGKQIASQVTVADAVIFLPLDHPWIVRRTLAVFEPAALIFLEREIWPNLLRCAHRRGIPTLLLSGRLSARALKKYSLVRVFFEKVVSQFSLLGMQTAEDAARMSQLGVDPEKVSVTGNLKKVSFTENRADNGDAFVHAENRNAKGCLLVVGSTHRGEEEILLEVFLSLKNNFPDLQMILAPRHPQRFEEVERLVQIKGIPFEKKSRMNGQLMQGADVLILDTIGDLVGFYALADIAFVGGSLVDAGGHNLLEPARYRKPVLFGPYMRNFGSLAAEMKERGGGIQVGDKVDLVREISELLNNPEKARVIGERAYAVAAEDHGVMERSIQLVSRYMES